MRLIKKSKFVNFILLIVLLFVYSNFINEDKSVLKEKALLMDSVYPLLDSEDSERFIFSTASSPLKLMIGTSLVSLQVPEENPADQIGSSFLNKTANHLNCDYSNRDKVEIETNSNSPERIYANNAKLNDGPAIDFEIFDEEITRAKSLNFELINTESRSN